MCLLRTNGEDETGGIADIILMAAKPSGAINLSHHVFDLNGLDGYVVSPSVVQAASGCGSERILRRGYAYRIIPNVSAAKQKLHIRIQARVPPVEPRTEHISE